MHFQAPRRDSMQRGKPVWRPVCRRTLLSTVCLVAMLAVLSAGAEYATVRVDRAIESDSRENALTFKSAGFGFARPEKSGDAYQFVGVWNEHRAGLSTITPLWRTWWVYSLYFLCVLGVLAAGIKYRVRTLERRNRQLEETVARRTAELRRTVEQLRSSEALTKEKARELAETAAKLERSEQRALEANRAKSVFLSSMSHELRTPLNAIIGFAQVLRSKGRLVGDDAEHLGIILRSSEHMLSLMNDVLSISKIEAGKTTIQTTAFDIHKLLQGMDEMFRLQAREKGILYSVDLAPEFPRYVIGDEGKLRQILINLIGNAFKFTERGEIVVNAGWTEGWGVIAVRDTGYGISPEECSSLFEAFAQTESGQRTQEGAGLGLVISRNFSRLMGGDVRVESETGKGSTFVVELPLPETDTDRGEADPVHVVGLAPGQPKLRMLVADVTPENRLLLKTLLSSVGFDVREADTGRVAVDIWREWRPDMIWMDANMSEINGLDVTTLIRAEQSGDEPVIVAVSASVFETHQQTMLDAGCNAFVIKPFDQTTIFRTISDLLGVRFVYAAVAKLEPAADEHIDVGERLGALDEGLLRVLYETLESGDLEGARQVVMDVGRRDPRLGEELRAWIRSYRIDDLLDLINQTLT